MRTQLQPRRRNTFAAPTSIRSAACPEAPSAALGAAPLAAGLPALLACLAGFLALAAPAARAQIILSEIMADPVALADARGEFVELANAGPAREAADSGWLVVDGDSLALGPVDLGAGEFLLLCRDSAALAAAGAPCRRGLPGMALANGRPLRVSVGWRDLRSDFEVPASAAGRSWENTFDDERGLRGFGRSGRAFLDGDSATPGFRNSRSLRPAARDLAIREAALLPGGVLAVDVEDRGSGAAASGLSVRLDRDWDGTAETPVDSAAVAAGGGRVAFALDADHLGILRVALDGDEDPDGNVRRLFRPGPRSLVISEVCPSPDAGPEWAEIRNAADRPLDLGRVEWDGKPLGPGAGRLGPGEYAILTEDAAGLRASLGPLRLRILEVPGWASLRNSGDTCRITLEGHGLDSLAYGARAAAASPCLARFPAKTEPAGPTGPAGRVGPDSAVPEGAATPGYASPVPPASPRLSVSPRILEPGGGFAIEAEVPPPASFALRVFDLEGNLLRVIAKGGPGRHALAWSGADGSGRPLPPGPYVIGLGVAGRAPVRKVVVLAGGP